MGRRKAHGRKGKAQSGGSHVKKKTTDPLEVPVVVKGKGGSTAAVHGLSNLGNTCFFNAVMQCIGQSHYFKARLEAHIQSPSFVCVLRLPSDNDRRDKEVCRTVTVQEKPGELTKKLNTFLSAMREGGGGTLNPKPVFSEICRKAPRFSGYHQQDSQELLRYLLDCLRSEEIYRIKKALLMTYNVSSGKAQVTEEDRREIRLYGVQAQLARTFVDDVFGGKLVSTVVCQECGNCSTIHETFLDLSLPIADDKGINQQSSREHKRNKSGKKEVTVSHSEVGKDPERESSPPLPSKKAVSKYQQKKNKKQQEKAAKKEAKKKAKKQQSLSLQEFLNAPSEGDSQKGEQVPTKVKENSEEGEAKMEEESAGHVESMKDIPSGQEVRVEEGGETQVDNSTSYRQTEDEMSSQRLEVEEGEIKVDDSVNDSQLTLTGNTESTESANVSTFPSDDQNVDPATEECKIVTMDTQNHTIEPREATAQDSTFLDYASTGPQPDQGKITDLLGAITLNDEMEAPTSVRKEGEGGGERREDSEPVNLTNGSDITLSDAALERLKVQSDSLEGSLKRFCTPELLTGSNKFACAVCTKEQAEKVVPLEQEEGNREEEGKRKEEVGERGEEVWKREKEMEESPKGENTSIEGEKKEIEEKDQIKENTHGSSEEKIENDLRESTVTDSVAARDSAPSEAEQGDEDKAVSSASCDGEEEHCPSSTNKQLPNEELSSSVPVFQKELLPGGEDELPLLEEDSEGEGEECFEKEGGKEEESVHVVFSDAKKQFLIESLPLILTLNLKRFIQYGRRLQKNSRHISFPVLLNMAPFCTDSCKVGRCDGQGRLLYSLYGVVEHSGGMQGGHYTAYVRTRTPVKHISSKMAATDKLEQHLPEQEQRLPDQLQLGVGEGSSESGATVVGGGEFDTSSSGGGQWYFISDSRVRVASESEVLKSQAYLLFYEQLPLLSE